MDESPSNASSDSDASDASDATADQASAGSDGNRQRRKSAGALGTILLTVFLDLVGFSIIFPLFPDMLDFYLGKETGSGYLHDLVAGLESFSGLEGSAARFAATVLFGGILGSLYSLLQFLFAPVWGILSDRHGRRRILIITIAGTSVSYLLWIVAGSFEWLVLSRLLGGLMAGNLSVATAAIADVTDSQSRSKGMGMIGAAFGLGFIVGPGIGALLSLWDVSAILPFVPGINPFSGAALFAFVLSAANLYLVLAHFPETLTPTTASALHARRPINPLALLRPSPYPGVNRTNLLNFVFIAAFSGMEFTLTFLAKDRFGYSASRNGLLFLYIGVLIAIVQGGVVRRIAPKYGERRLATVGLAMLIPGLFLVGSCQTETRLYGGLFLLAVGSSLVTPCLTALVSLYTPEDRQGESLGVFRSVGSLARAIAPLIAAMVYWRYGSQWPYFGSGLLMLLPLGLLFGLPTPGASKPTSATTTADNQNP